MLTAVDRARLEEEGRDPADVEAQLRRLAGPKPTTRLVRPATVGDGILRLSADAVDRYAALGDGAGDRLSWFIPASGAATRMSAAVVRAWEGASLSAAEEAVVEAVVDGAERLAMWPLLAARGAVAGERASVLRALVGPGGIGLDGMPKGLVPFFTGPRGPRTPVAAHLVEAGRWLGGGAVTLHLTVQEAWRAAFAVEVARAAEREGVRVDASFSVQDPATDTPSLVEEGDPLRGPDGALVFRPGGHGALLTNLARWPGDLVVVRNVDNVTPEPLLADALRWRKALVGLLVAARADPEAVGLPLAAVREDRPWRVAGMVAHTGQPGGGPFWAHGPDGVGLQIVEAAQVGERDAAILAAATHFNPVELVLSMRRVNGRAHELRSFIDPDAVIVTEKVQAGRRTRVLERPGLWNGGMARWNTLFVEVPPFLFRPVKTVADLLAPAEQG